ncbi:MAG TPA: YciI family protein, partial [Cyclobacteriaceae bacterium]|nr:YciI family protein [Cyclobacteriaceae bacterium]
MKSILLTIIILSSQCVFAQSLVFVFLHHKADKAELPKDQVDKIMEGHMANIQRMAKEGKLLVAGPFEGGGGVFIFNSSNVNEVKQWLNDDPGVKAQRWNVEIQPYHSRIGK